MKKVIKGRIYNTETAKKIGADSYSAPGDFYYYCDELFQKRTGEFFIYGVGGAMSKYAETIGQNQWSGGEAIIPMTYENARKWCEEHLDGDEYEAVFGKIEEDDEKKTVALRLSASAVEKIKREASKKDCTMSDVVEDLIKAL